MSSTLLGIDPVRRALYIAGMVPAVLYFHWGVTDRLGADPQNVLERALGLWALRFLIATLAIAPIRTIGGPNLVRYRRALGLLSFYYAMLHVAVYVLLDKQLDVFSIAADIVRRPYITVGMLAFVVLVPLAVTSNGPMIRKLGARWRKLHRLIYLAAAAAALHFIMLVKAWSPEPLIYAVLVVALLLFRALPLKVRWGT
ncbi:MAG: protein-methionine-sulfoxide reductase heme-binding subunit MsrQ [Hyphomicrobiaceae bacterium]